MSFLFHRPGFSLLELIVSLALFTLLGIIAVRYAYSVTEQKKDLDTLNLFHFQGGRLMESLKQDLRSASAVKLTPIELDVMRPIENGKGDFSQGKVQYRVASASIQEIRDGKIRIYDFQTVTNALQGRFEAAFSGSPAPDDAGKVARISLGFAIRGKDSRMLENYAATASVEVKAASITLAP